MADRNSTCVSKAVVGGSISMPYAFRLNPFIIVSSGQPFNVTVGQDVNGDSIFNDRAGLVTELDAAERH